MDNSRVGGKDTGSVSAGSVFESGNRETENRETENRELKPTVAAEDFMSEIKPFGGEAVEKQGSTDRSLGGSAVTSEGIFTAAPAPEVRGATSEGAAEATPGFGENDTELHLANASKMNPGESAEELALKPLAADGSTEKNVKKKFGKMDGENISPVLKQKIDKEIEQHINDPFELDNVRNKEMSEFLRDEYGRVFGDDGNEELNDNEESAKIIKMGNVDKKGGSIAA